MKFGKCTILALASIAASRPVVGAMAVRRGERSIAQHAGDTRAARMLKRKRSKKTKSPTAAPSIGPTPTPTPTTPKRGLIIGDQVMQASVEHFNSSVSWFYNYKQTVRDWQGAWADENGIEFVPMIPQPFVFRTDGSKCYFESSKAPLCTLQEVIDVLNMTKVARDVPVRYLLGFNDMYNNGPPEDLTPQEATDYWHTFVQPAAIKVDLTLVSPTTNTNGNGPRWLAEFIKLCWDQRENATAPCNVELISQFAAHQYHCEVEQWDTDYGEGGQMSIKLKNELGDYGGYDWESYLNMRQFWITETNCYWGVDWQTAVPHPSSKEQCLRITGQAPTSHGVGTVAKLDMLPDVQRYAWWTTWNKQIKPNYLTYRSGTLTPAGRGYLEPVDTTDCEFHGTRYEASDALLTNEAQLVACGTTKVIKGLGGPENGTAVFTVSVPSAGDYALNVGFVTAAERDLSVRVNQDEVSEFTFVSMGLWCNQGGVPNILPIELTGLIAGNNTITLGGASGHNEPLIEWFSVVA